MARKMLCYESRAHALITFPLEIVAIFMSHISHFFFLNDWYYTFPER